MVRDKQLPRKNRLMKKAFTLLVLIASPTMAFGQGTITIGNTEFELVQQWIHPRSAEYLRAREKQIPISASALRVNRRSDCHVVFMIQAPMLPNVSRDVKLIVCD